MKVIYDLRDTLFIEKRRDNIKAIHRKILILVVCSILISSLGVMGIAVKGYDTLLLDNSKQIMQLMCSEKKQTINEKLFNIEQSVHTIYHFAVEQIKEEGSVWQNDKLYSEHIGKMRELMKTVAKYTDGAVSVYYRLNPQLRSSKEGIWMVQNDVGEFTEYEVTDISKYDKNDMEHVGWYYIPVENGKATWLEPYYNGNMDLEMISYVIPIMSEEGVIGVVGMDITTELLYENVKSVTVYNTGYAFLMDAEGNFVYHPEMTDVTGSTIFDEEHAYLYEKSVESYKKKSVEKYQWNEMDKRLTTQKLCNGMLFTVCVPDKEIIRPQQQMLIRSVVILFFMLAVFLLIAVKLAKAIVGLAYKDAMTGLGNKAGYNECVEILNKRIENKDKFDFAILV